jgi:cyclophilin family peptidyl-prolyl cis-trans isomerase
MRRISTLVVVFVVGMLFTRSVAAPAASAGAVKAVLELNQQFFYVGDPLNVRISITNSGSTEVSNPIKSPLYGGFTVSDAHGKKLDGSGKSEAQEPARPSKLGGNAFYGSVYDLTQAYPQLKTKGKYSIRWSADGIASDPIELSVIPRFDSSKDYTARVETELGSFVIDLSERSAPLAVKSFVDLANAGFYDGLLIHEARGDQLIGGGDPTGTGRGQAPLRYPAELSAVPVIAGSVLMKPAGLAPPANGSQFVIPLQAQPSWLGQFTVLGQVTDGLDIVKKISNVPTADPPSHKPLKDVHTLHVTIVEKSASVPPPTGAPAANGAK